MRKFWEKLGAPFSRYEYVALVILVVIALVGAGLTIKRNFISPTDENSTPTTIIKLSTSDHYHDNSTVKVLPNNIIPDTGSGQIGCMVRPLPLMLFSG